MPKQPFASVPQSNRSTRANIILGAIAVVVAVLGLIPTVFMWHPWSNGGSSAHARVPVTSHNTMPANASSPRPTSSILWTPLTASRWRGFGIAQTSSVSGGVIEVSFEQPLTLQNKWAGIIAGIPPSCHYEIEMQARISDQIGGDQSGGYGVALGTLGPMGIPSGTAFQYDFGFGGYRELVYPDDFQQTNRYWNAPLDHEWHQIKLIFSDGITAYVDGSRIFSYSGAASCGVPIIRVWSASAEFRNIVTR